MRQFLAVIALVVLALAAAPPASAAGKGGKKMSAARLQDINWGRRSDIVARYWPFHQHPNVRIY